jgi:hypothetical protein
LYDDAAHGCDEHYRWAVRIDCGVDFAMFDTVAEGILEFRDLIGINLGGHVEVYFAWADGFWSLRPGNWCGPIASRTAPADITGNEFLPPRLPGCSYNLFPRKSPRACCLNNTTPNKRYSFCSELTNHGCRLVF